MSDEPTFDRNDEASRYELWVDGKIVSIADFVERGRDIEFPHTETAPEYRGRGLAEVLVRKALDDAKERGLNPVPKCSFVGEVMDRLRTAS
jgi:predicted GNAT family acetyltransferase